VEKDTLDVVAKYEGQFKEVISFEENRGGGWGHVQVMRACLKEDTPFCMYMEDDFICCEPLTYYLNFIFKFFEVFKDFGCIRLRSWKECKYFNYDTVIYGKHKDLVKPEVPFYWDYKRDQKGLLDTSQTIFEEVKNTYVFNPHIVKSEVLQMMLPSRKHYVYNEKIAETIWRDRLKVFRMAQIHANLFRHNKLSQRIEDFKL